MVDEEAGTSATTESAPDLGWHPVGANPTDPGWYPSGVNPNEQAYWDGQTWTAKRHWTVNGWVEEGGAAAAAAPAHRAGRTEVVGQPLRPTGLHQAQDPPPPP